MAKEQKLTASVKGVALPAVYATDHLKIGDVGAIVVYIHPVVTTQEVDGKTTQTTTYQTDSVAIRFCQADEPLDDAVIRQLTSAIPALMASYLGGNVDYTLNQTIAGKLTYEFTYHKNMMIVISRVLLGSFLLGEAHYLGSQPSETSEPTQSVWSITPTPAAVENTVKTALTEIIKTKLYGG